MSLITVLGEDMNNINSIISKNIAALRRNAKMTQAELAEKLGYSDKAVSKWERGDGVPDVQTLKLIAELFETTLDYIVSEHKSEIVSAPISKRKRSYAVITALSVLCVWFLAVIIFVTLEMTITPSKPWLVFIAAVPASFIVLLVFNSIWGKMVRNFPIMSALVWTMLTFIFFLVPSDAAWMVFLVGIPLQVGVILWSVLILPVKAKKKHQASQANDNKDTEVKKA